MVHELNTDNPRSIVVDPQDTDNDVDSFEHFEDGRSSFETVGIVPNV